MKLEGKVVIVAGAGPGIGEGVVKVLASEGADIAVVDINEAEAKRIAEDVKKAGRKAVAVKADLTDEEECEKVVKTTLDSLDKIDGLANIVGGLGSIRLSKDSYAFVDLTAAEWEQMFKLNLMTCFFMCKAIAPYFMERKYGKIVNTASVAAASGYGEEGMVYGCSKAAVQYFSKSLAVTLAPYNINVNILNPGSVWTPGFHAKYTAQKRKLHPEWFVGKTDKEYFDSMVGQKRPLKRLLTPEDMGHMVAFLLSDEAQNITGQANYVDGGAYMG